jgi:hypothetical protein
METWRPAELNGPAAGPLCQHVQQPNFHHFSVMSPSFLHQPLSTVVPARVVASGARRRSCGRRRGSWAYGERDVPERPGADLGDPAGLGGSLSNYESLGDGGRSQRIGLLLNKGCAFLLGDFFRSTSAPPQRPRTVPGRQCPHRVESCSPGLSKDCWVMTPASSSDRPWAQIDSPRRPPPPTRPNSPAGCVVVCRPMPQLPHPAAFLRRRPRISPRLPALTRPRPGPPAPRPAPNPSVRCAVVQRS